MLLKPLNMALSHILLQYGARPLLRPPLHQGFICHDLIKDWRLLLNNDHNRCLTCKRLRHIPKLLILLLYPHQLAPKMEDTVPHITLPGLLQWNVSIHVRLRQRRLFHPLDSGLRRLPPRRRLLCNSSPSSFRLG